MERNFKNEDFEQFLKQNADGLRMRPSEKVWKGISSQLNRRRRRYGLFLGLSLLATSALSYYLIQPSMNTAVARNTAAISDNTTRTKLPEVIQPTQNISNRNQQAVSSSQSNASRNLTAAIFNPAGAADVNAFSPVASLTGDPSTLKDAENKNDFQSTIVDSYPGTESASVAVKKNEPAKPVVDPMTIESVTNSYVPKKKGKLGLQLFFTPTVSYRRLRENTDYSGSSLFGSKDVNAEVKHKPDLGFQIGMLAKYPVSNNLKLRGGLQFNVNRYDIRAFTSTYEVATIRFSNRQTVNTVTGYNNYQGYSPNWLENLYLQVSAPLGAELKISGDDKNNFGVAASIQPTYILGDNVYLISTDYKNYMEVPWLVRHWNVNTSFETFVSYTTGKTRWQVGPQVRYQMLSSYEKKYPVKEHLFDFGLRVGVSLNNR